jgi:hypothetical protein
MTKILTLNTLNDYLIKGNCKHFAHFVHLAKGFVSKELALQSVKAILPEHHKSHPNVNPANLRCINRECMRTCKAKFTVEQVDAS